MDFSSISSLGNAVLIILFIIPGFLAEWIFSLFVLRIQRDNQRVILESLVFSCFIYSFVLPIVNSNYAFISNHLLLFGIIFLLITPFLSGLILGLLFRYKAFKPVLSRLGIRNPIPKAWDYFFSREEPCLVLITLQDDTKIGGIWHCGSFASSYPSDEDLYLEAQYKIEEDGSFSDELPYTKGCLVSANTIKLIEFFEIQPKETTNGEAK